MGESDRHRITKREGRQKSTREKTSCNASRKRGVKKMGSIQAPKKEKKKKRKKLKSLPRGRRKKNISPGSPQERRLGRGVVRD